jgi:hypothetical protein
MMPDDIDRDPALHRHLVLLRRHEPTSADFTDGVIHDLARRGLVRRSPSVLEARWLAAAGIIFALGVGVGTAVAAARTPVLAAQPIPREPAQRVAAEVNLPPSGKSEVWF